MKTVNSSTRYLFFRRKAFKVYPDKVRNPGVSFFVEIGPDACDRWRIDEHDKSEEIAGKNNFYLPGNTHIICSCGFVNSYAYSGVCISSKALVSAAII